MDRESHVKRILLRRTAGAVAFALALAGRGAPPPAAPPAVTIATAAPSTSAAPQEPGARGRKLLAAWEAGHGKKIDQRASLGAFSAARDVEGAGAIATDEGLLEVRWRELVSADRDVDADGRADLLLILAPDWDLPDDHPERRPRPSVLADRAGGPVPLPVDGAPSAHWASVRWTADPAPVFEMTAGRRDSGHATMAWDGKAFVVRDANVVAILCNDQPFQDPAHPGILHARAGVIGADCWAETVAHGAERRAAIGDVAFYENWGMEEPPPQVLFDLAGDGPRFYVLQYRPGGMADDEATQTRFGLVLEKGGWTPIDVAGVDPGTAMDRDGDGKPEVETSAGGVALALCPKKDDCGAPRASVFNLVTWDGARFAGSPARPERAFVTWVEQAKKEVVAVDSGICPVGRVELAGRVYLGARRSGGAEKAALAAMSDVMKGSSLAPCASGGMRARTWPEVQRDLVAVMKRLVTDGEKKTGP